MAALFIALTLSGLYTGCSAGSAFTPFKPGLPEVTWPRPADAPVEPDRRHSWCHVSALKGQIVSCLIDQDVGTVVDNAGYMKAGYYAKLMDEAARRGGFQWHSKSALLNATLSGEHTFDDMIDWASSHYDIFLGAAAATQKRRRVFRFGFPLTPGSPVFIVPFHREGASLLSQIFAFLSPFKAPVWLAILVLFISTGVFYRWLEPDSEDLSGHTPSEALGQSVFLAMGSFTGGAGFAPSTPAGRVLVLGWTFTILLLTSAYTANLASLLVVKGSQSADVKSLAEAARRGVKVCVPEGTIYHQVVMARLPGLRVVPISRALQTQPVLDGTCAGMVEGEDFWDVWRGQSATNPRCKLGVVGTPILRMDGSFLALSSTRDPANQYCTDKLMDLLSSLLQGMYQDNFVADAYEDSYKARWDMAECGTEKEAGEDPALGLVHMMGIFCVYFAVAVVAAACHTNRSAAATRELRGSEAGRPDFSRHRN